MLTGVAMRGFAPPCGICPGQPTVWVLNCTGSVDAGSTILHRSMLRYQRVAARMSLV